MSSKVLKGQCMDKRMLPGQCSPDERAKHAFYVQHQDDEVPPSSCFRRFIL